MKTFFTKKLIEWHLTVNKRTMPWKEEKDPYKIWLSEIILQQTRVEQGLSYYNKIVGIYPTVEQLAGAPDDEVFKLWEGLGYYSRCRNLISTAKFITKTLNGRFPEQYEAILALKGVGPYTAAAIASFAYNLPYAVVDGNVLRVLARFFGKEIAVDSKEGLRYFSQLAQQLLPAKKAALYNQAIMDFGATVCKPKVARCSICPIKSKCVAFNKGLVNQLPVKEKLLIKKDRWIYYFVFSHNTHILVHQRTGGIWEGLFEFYLLEQFSVQHWTKDTINQWLQAQMGITGYHLKSVSPVYKQQLTHQNISGQFIAVDIAVVPESLLHMQKIEQNALQSLAFPKFINQYLQNEAVSKSRQPLLF